jgi:hypothetical protein
MDRWARRLGVQQLVRGRTTSGLANVLNPIVLPRYFEFDFCLRHMPSDASSILDVGSPRLLSLYVAKTRPAVHITIVNPDPVDLRETEECAALLGLDNVQCKLGGIREILAAEPMRVDYIYSVSVLEHIAGAYDDSAVIPDLMNALVPQGVLAFTVPLSANKQHEDEYLPVTAVPYPGTSPPTGPDGRLFFQRLYTEDSIRSRLLAPAGDPAAGDMEWWGETRGGFWAEYTRSRRYKRGYDCRVFLDEFARFESYADLPGLGVCGVAVGAP